MEMSALGIWLFIMIFDYDLHIVLLNRSTVLNMWQSRVEIECYSILDSLLFVFVERVQCQKDHKKRKSHTKF
jgi:hypothetical protein